MFEKFLPVLRDTADTLNSYALHLGSFKLSVLDLMKGIIAFTVLYWMVKIITKFIKNKFKKSQRLSGTQKVLYVKLINLILIALAVFVGLNILGINITTLAIFGSAIGIGIGFGLQKIFSNLISGIIILMDNSIKPGDVIAVGDTYGAVVNLEARYVSIITRDGKAHLIPNETLITNSVENWSYGNSRLRLKIPVGVAYNSDLRQVAKLLVEAAKEHPRVLAEPEPKALILDFGASTVDFELRAWIDDPANGIQEPKSDIYFIIWDKFHKNNIELPFSQLDVRLRSLDK